jgi:hypothetical protein
VTPRSSPPLTNVALPWSLPVCATSGTNGYLQLIAEPLPAQRTGFPQFNRFAADFHG